MATRWGGSQARNECQRFGHGSAQTTGSSTSMFDEQVMKLVKEKGGSARYTTEKIRRELIETENIENVLFELKRWLK